VLPNPKPMSESQSVTVQGLTLLSRIGLKKSKDYILIVLLTLIGVFGTISCLLSDNSTAQNYTVQTMIIGNY